MRDGAVLVHDKSGSAVIEQQGQDGQNRQHRKPLQMESRKRQFHPPFIVRETKVQNKLGQEGYPQASQHETLRLVKVEQNAPLAPYTSWLIGGPADRLLRPASVEELRTSYLETLKRGEPITVLSGGSNVLISDRGIRGVTLVLKDLNRIQVSEVNGRLNLVCEAGVKKGELLKNFLKWKLDPALFLAGIPGDVGGGIVMNAGVAESFRPREFCELVDWIEVLRPTGEIERILTKDLKWSYRHCHGWQPGVIVRAQLSWPLEPRPEVLNSVKEANRIRLSKQPLDLPSCGSVFVNPPGHKAAQLIDSCGLKGARRGDAQVSLKHANFIVNLSEATARDTWNLMMEVRETVLQKTGVSLQTEVVRLGDWEDA